MTIQLWRSSPSHKRGVVSHKSLRDGTGDVVSWNRPTRLRRRGQLGADMILAWSRCQWAGARAGTLWLRLEQVDQPGPTESQHETPMKRTATDSRELESRKPRPLSVVAATSGLVWPVRHGARKHTAKRNQRTDCFSDRDTGLPVHRRCNWQWAEWHPDSV